MGSWTIAGRKIQDEYQPIEGKKHRSRYFGVEARKIVLTIDLEKAPGRSLQIDWTLSSLGEVEFRRRRTWG